MRTLSDSLRKQVADILYPHVQNAMTLEEVYNSFVEPPQPEMGDLAFGCFPLAKALKQAPPKIAQELKLKIAGEIKEDADLSKDPVEGQIFSRIEAAGPYLNFTFTSQNIGVNFLNEILSQKYFSKKLTEEPPKTMIEHCSVNTHKELHVGHMRNASLGDALVRMHRYCGYEVVASTFPGDMGTHVAKCLWYLKYRNEEALPTEHKGEWLGRMYSKASLQLEDETGTPKEVENRAQLTEILKELESKKGSFFEMWQITRQWSIELMHNIYRWGGIEFDQWYWESEVDTPSVQFIKKLYNEGKIEMSQGALGMNLESEGLGFCLLLKSDGTGLYATKDIELARRKFEGYKIESNIYVVDVRQALHFKQVFRVLEKIGFPQAKHCFHLQYNFVELPDGAMSSRKGNIVPLTDLISQMENVVKTEYLSRYAQEWSQDEIDLVASQVAQGAIKYGMLRMDTNKKIVFDMKEWLKLDGESGPFVQYSAARINSLIKKIGAVDADIKWSVLTHKSERQLMQALMSFNQQVLNATENYKPHSLCTYLYDLAKRSNSFYHDCPIANAGSDDLKNARLALSQCTGLVLQKGLMLLGIPAPERM